MWEVYDKSSGRKQIRHTDARWRRVLLAYGDKSADAVLISGLGACFSYLPAPAFAVSRSPAVGDDSAGCRTPGLAGTARSEGGHSYVQEA